MTNDLPQRHTDIEIDNRDSRTTWLWIGGYGNEYLEVDPVELIENMIENCAHVITDHEIYLLVDGAENQVTAEELQTALQILQRV